MPQIEDVDRFYARQSRQILERIARVRSARPAGVRTALLAAAAMLAFAALGLAVLPGSLPPQPTQAGELEPIVSLPDSLPLSTYSSWSTDEMLDREDLSEMGGIDWLLDDEALLAGSNSLPGFLQPFGSWPAAPDRTQEVESI